MQDLNPAVTSADRAERRCPSCSTRLDHTGTGGDELLECPQCGLVMFQAPAGESQGVARPPEGIR
jgi:hypothetical protein